MFKSTASSRKVSVVVCSLFVVLFIVSTANARTYEKIVAFGDSLSDHSGLQAYIGAYDPAANPSGALEVWSNGDVWVEYLAHRWGVPLENNSIAGAMTRGHENETVQMMSDSGRLPQLGLVGQVAMYVASSPEFDPEETLFAIWIGGNNLLEFGRGKMHTADPIVMITDAMTDIKDSIVSLYSQGASHFLVLNLPDIGKSPAYNKKDPAIIGSVTRLVQSYNGALAAAVAGLEAGLEGVTIYSFDVFEYFDVMLESGVFANVTDTYMELDADGNKTGYVTGNAEDYIFWDNIHPMTKAHEMVAVEVDETLFSVKSSSSSTCFITSINTGSSDASRNYVFFIMAALFGVMIAFAAGEKFKENMTKKHLR
ncbi:MAG: SGNH/GDSL hydrolase family protein [Desulfamplus sp.]|nr:SGNH/GDSL hydrolase family protein [Desulfamplus sp.]